MPLSTYLGPVLLRFHRRLLALHPSRFFESVPNRISSQRNGLFFAIAFEDPQRRIAKATCFTALPVSLVKWVTTLFGTVPNPRIHHALQSLAIMLLAMFHRFRSLMMDRDLLLALEAHQLGDTSPQNV